MVEFLNIEQGTDEWLQARAGVVTASRFKDVMAKGQGKTRQKYLYELAGEIITGEPMPSFSNAHMARGHELEPEARELYGFITGVEPELVGFAKRGRAGASPDSLIGNDGLLEIKTKLPHLMIEVLDRDRFPPEHVAQCQGQLWVTERDWIDIAVYWPGFPMFVKRATRDEELIKEIAAQVDRFTDELDEVVSKIRNIGAAA